MTTPSPIKRLSYAALNLSGEQRRLLLDLVREYTSGFVPRSDPPSQMVNHDQPLYERRRAEDLRAGDIIWWNNNEVLVTATDARASVATRDPLVRVHYLSAYVAYSTALLRLQVVLARVRAPVVTDRTMDGLFSGEVVETLPVAFWRAAVDALLSTDIDVDDTHAAVVWRFPHIARDNEALPIDPRAYDETTGAQTDDDDDHSVK